MGNSHSDLNEFEGSLNSSIEETCQSDLSSPVRKRLRFPGKSLSLRSLTSLGKNKNFSTNLFSIFKSEEKSAEGLSKISTIPRGKRKREESLPDSYKSQSGYITTFWRETIFLPEFPFRDDICISDFKILNVIGHGTFGNVVRACWVNNGYSLVAIKAQNKKKVFEKGAERQVKSEVMLHKNLESHNFIVKFIDCWQTTTHLYSVMEYVNGYGDLYALWNDYGCMSEEAIQIYSAEIALAIGFLHDRQIVYRDLKMENLALDMEMHIKLVDFGFAKYLNGNRTNTICGTLQYMAPEIAWGDFYGFAVDWFSYGTILYILFTGKYPFPNGHAELHTQLVFQCYKAPAEASPSFKDFLERLLEVDDQLRISKFQQVVGHSFFEGLSFEDVLNRKVRPWDLIKKRIDLTAHSHSEKNIGFVEEFDGFEYVRNDDYD